MAALEGKTAIVTGASSGIGAATAAALAREGARVAGGARRVDELQTEIKLELDVTDRESCERFVETAVGKLGGLDILINNAGLGLGRDPFWESTEEDEDTVLETDVHGLLRMTRLCLPHIRDGGHIVNMGSIAGRQPYENAAVYVASKYAVRGFTYALREDLLGRPIRLTTVDPGLVESNFSRVREGAVRRRRPPPSRRHRRMHPLRAHPTPPRQHRRARRQSPGPIEPSPHRPDLTCRS